MSPHIISTRPLDDNEMILQKKFNESMAAQSELMNKVSAQLLTVELAIPGLFATSLKLLYGEEATLPMDWALYLTFACWLAALVLTLLALIPKTWDVDPNVLRQDPEKFSEGIGIEDFFEQSALYKRRLVIASSILFFAGIFCALFTLG